MHIDPNDKWAYFIPSIFACSFCWLMHLSYQTHLYPMQFLTLAEWELSLVSQRKKERKKGKKRVQSISVHPHSRQANKEKEE